MVRMRALVKALSVSTLSWWPRKLRALPPCAWMAMAVSAAVTCSPVAARASTSRPSGIGLTSDASLSRRLVSPDIALTMTTTSWPARWVARARAATLRMRSTLATDVPPNFWTMRATRRPSLVAAGVGVNHGSTRRGEAPQSLRRGGFLPMSSARNALGHASWTPHEAHAGRWA